MKQQTKTIWLIAACGLVGACYLGARWIGWVGRPQEQTPAPGSSIAQVDASPRARNAVALWTRFASVAKDDRGTRPVAVAVDRDGNAAMVGTLRTSADFGGGALQTQGESDVFVVKYDGAGKHLWTKRFGAPGEQSPGAVAFDPQGNVLVAGTIDGATDFGGGLLQSAGLIDIFVLKLDPAGNHVWSKRFGDAAEQEAGGMAVDRDGNVVVVGSYEGTLDFGGGPLPSAGRDDVYVAKFSAKGDHLWSRRFGDGQHQKGRRVATDAEGDVVFGGVLYGTADFGGDVLRSPDASALFLVKLDPAGKHMWSKQFAADAGALADPRAIEIDAADAIVVAGVYRGTINLGGTPLVSRAGQETQGFVGKFDPSGGHLWSKELGATSEQDLCGIGPRADGSLVIGGTFMERIQTGADSLTSEGKDDVFVEIVDRAGTHRSGSRFGDAERQNAVGLAVDRSGNTLLAGFSAGAIDFGTGREAGPGIFLVKFAP